MRSSRPPHGPLTNPISLTSEVRVHVCCAKCNTQLGIYENKWTRLTSTYVVAKRKGSYYGTIVSSETTVIPQGPEKKLVDGCTVSEVKCRGCSRVYGLVCVAPGGAKAKAFVGSIFHKLSRVNLTDATTRQPLEPVFDQPSNDRSTELASGHSTSRDSEAAFAAPSGTRGSAASVRVRPQVNGYHHSASRSSEVPIDPRLYEDGEQQDEEDYVQESDDYNDNEAVIFDPDLTGQQGQEISRISKSVDSLKVQMQVFTKYLEDMRSANEKQAASQSSLSETLQTLDSAVRDLGRPHPGPAEFDQVQTEKAHLQAEKGHLTKENSDLKAKLDQFSAMLESTIANVSHVPNYNVVPRATAAQSGSASTPLSTSSSGVKRKKNFENPKAKRNSSLRNEIHPDAGHSEEEGMEVTVSEEAQSQEKNVRLSERSTGQDKDIILSQSTPAQDQNSNQWKISRPLNGIEEFADRGQSALHDPPEPFAKTSSLAPALVNGRAQGECNTDNAPITNEETFTTPINSKPQAVIDRGNQCHAIHELETRTPINMQSPAIIERSDESPTQDPRAVTPRSFPPIPSFRDSPLQVILQLSPAKATHRPTSATISHEANSVQPSIATQGSEQRSSGITDPGNSRLPSPNVRQTRSSIGNRKVATEKSPEQENIPSPPHDKQVTTRSSARTRKPTAKTVSTTGKSAPRAQKSRASSEAISVIELSTPDDNLPPTTAVLELQENTAFKTTAIPQLDGSAIENGISEGVGTFNGHAHPDLATSDIRRSDAFKSMQSKSFDKPVTKNREGTPLTRRIEQDRTELSAADLERLVTEAMEREEARRMGGM